MEFSLAITDEIKCENNLLAYFTSDNLHNIVYADVILWFLIIQVIQRIYRCAVACEPEIKIRSLNGIIFRRL